jgi:hypothetical protein
MANEVLVSNGLAREVGLESWVCSFTKPKLPGEKPDAMMIQYVCNRAILGIIVCSTLRRGEPLQLLYCSTPCHHLETTHHPLLICLPLHVSHSPHGFFILQPSLQFPTDHQQCLRRIQETHEERSTCTSPRHRAPILQLSQCHSLRPSPASSRARSVPKKRRPVDPMA